MPDFETDDLPPTQSLALEVLAARYRLGETLWTFSARHRPALLALEKRGLVSVIHGIVERTCRVSLTEAGRTAVLMDGYVPPQGTVTQWAVRVADPGSGHTDESMPVASEEVARAAVPAWRRGGWAEVAVVSRQVGPWTQAPEPAEDEQP